MLIDIDFRDKRPLYEQIMTRFEELILKGVMSPDDAMPSVRQLAVELSINPNTIQKAYAALEQNGYTYSVSGRGSFVANVEDIMPKKREEILMEFDALIRRALGVGITAKEIEEHIREFVSGEDKK